MDKFSLIEKSSIESNKILLNNVLNDKNISNIGYFNFDYCKNKKYKYLYFYFNISKLKKNCNIKGVLISYSKDKKTWFGRGKSCIIEVKLIDEFTKTIYDLYIGYNSIKNIYFENIFNELNYISDYIDKKFENIINIYYSIPIINKSLPICTICKNILLICNCDEYDDDDDY